MNGVRIVEVGPRDGLQNEKLPIETAAKLRFIERLARAGLREIEATSFVSPHWVPQLADAGELWPQLPEGPLYSALVPNLKGLERALKVGVRRIALFTAASDAFTRKNINMSVDESLLAFSEVIHAFRASHLTRDPYESRAAHNGAAISGHVRGYVSTVFECPYAGLVEPDAVLRVLDGLFNLGVDEVSLGDTTGVASPVEVRRLAKAVTQHFGRDIVPRVAWHFHDTWGSGTANVSAALEEGFLGFDAGAGGLGGCPYAPGAGGNLATEDLVYLLERSGLKTGVDLDLLSQASIEILSILGRQPSARAQVASLARASVL